MTYLNADIADGPEALTPIPGWITGTRPESPEDAAFSAGAALGCLDVALRREDVPHALLRNRLALRAAERCVQIAGRPERARDLRDAVAFVQPGDCPGPAGSVLLAWRRAVERPVSARALQRALPDVTPEHIAVWLDAGQGAAIARAARVLQAVLGDRPRDPAAALLLADAALARALGWRHVTPLLALGVTRDDLRKTGADLRAACHRAVLTAAVEAAGQTADLTRRAARLRAVVPKLRARGATEAAALLLTRDAVAPGALSVLRSDRAARRFCDRLVALGVARELTGRDTFRLYGV